MPRKFKTGDRVQIVSFGRKGWTGTVARVWPKKRPVGGVKATVRVRWDAGGSGTVEDRVLVHISKAKED